MSGIVSLKALVEATLHKASLPSSWGMAFLSSGEQKFAMGRNEDTLLLHQMIGLTGVIDDFYSETHWQGIPVMRTRNVGRGAWVVNCSTSISPIQVGTHLRGAGFGQVIDFHELVRAADGALRWPWFVRDQRAECRDYLDSWCRMDESFADNISRQTFRDVLCYRLSADADYMAAYSVRLDEQYLEDFMHYENEVFVDAGGFDGDTTQFFADRYPDYRGVYLFEPSVRNMQAAKKRLAGYRDISFIQKGVSDAVGVLAFDESAGSASAVNRSGGGTIEVDRLDALVNEPVTTIKMDLEGWEMHALHGATEHIAQNRPKLAISVYHKASDFRLVHEFANSFGHNYQCFMRHYTQGWSETIMYFVPK